MEYVRQTMNGAELNNFISLPPTLYNMKVEIIVLPVENKEIAQRQKPKRQLGFWDGPPLPDSFFDPMPEEDLKAWGL